MASIINSLLLLFLSPLTLSLPFPPTASSRSALIQNTCNATSYYDLCISSLESDPQSPTADVKGLSSIAVGIAVSNATETSAYASNLARSTAELALRPLLTACAGRYANAREALLSSLDALSAESYDYAFVHVSAAAEYPGVCRVLFRQHLKLTYPAELARREEALEHLCTMASEMISLLG